MQTQTAQWITADSTVGDRVRFIDQKDGVTIREGVIAYEQWASYFNGMFFTIRDDAGYKAQVLIVKR